MVLQILTCAENQAFADRERFKRESILSNVTVCDSRLISLYTHRYCFTNQPRCVSLADIYKTLGLTEFHPSNYSAALYLALPLFMPLTSSQSPCEARFQAPLILVKYNGMMRFVS
jgi:hypothetical protein